MTSYINNANNIYLRLIDNMNSFEKEALLIDELKCHLINFHNLDDFEYGGVYIIDNGNSYSIMYDGHEMAIEVDEGIITNFYYD